MGNLYLLDCTLRDGGYVNDWNFGKTAISAMIDGLEVSGVDILELGFIRDEPTNDNRTVFSSIEDVDRLLTKKKRDILYSAMIEAFSPYPLNKLSPHRDGGTDLIRVCIWKRCMEEHLAYCRAVADKGYQISIQPSRVEQYNQSEFIDMLKRVNELHPFSVYVVDTWGTQSSTQICRYIELADRWLASDVKVGYHGHNNKMQSLSCAQAFLHMGLERDICLDSSIMGMGRGAGNLNTEIIMDYLNETQSKSYDTRKVVGLYNICLENTYKEMPWGYSMYYYLSAVYGCNPNYATFFSEKGYSEALFERFLNSITENEKIVFDSDLVKKKLTEFRGDPAK